MKFMKAALAPLSLAVLSVATTASAGSVAEEGRHMISGAWLHVDTSQVESEPLKTSRIATGASQQDNGTSFSLNDADTFAFTYTYFINDNWSAQLLGGVPPRFKLAGNGHSSLVGDLGSYGTLAEVRQWSPTALAIYTFGNPTQAFRPYVGIGAAYTRFDDIEMNPALEAAFVHGVKTITSGAALDVGVRAEADDTWDPVVTVGAQYGFAPRWYAIASVSYLPLSTTATVTTTVKQSAAPALLPTGDFSRSQASMDINPIVSYLGIGYRF